MNINETQLKQFSQQIGADPKADKTKLAFCSIQALYRMTTEDVEEGEISCSLKDGKIFVELESDCFCIRAPYLQEFLDCIRLANKLSIKKKDDGFLLTVEFSI